MVPPSNLNHPIYSFFSGLKNNKYSDEILYSHYYPQPGLTLSFRSLTHQDLEIIYEWVNLPYAKRFWQMNGSKTKLVTTYEQVLNSNYEHSFLGILKDKIICQWDLYHVQHDELGTCYQADEGDVGIHLLMAPRPSGGLRYLSLFVINTILQYLFAHPFIKNVTAEPDNSNIKACQLLHRVGFTWSCDLKMSTKKASLFHMTAEDFSASSYLPDYSSQYKQVYYEKK